MNPIVSAAVGSLLRWALALGASWLVERGVWTQAEAGTYVAAAVLGLLSLGWSLWKNSKGRTKLLTALHWANTTEDALHGYIAVGGATPPTSTPKDTVPQPAA